MVVYGHSDVGDRYPSHSISDSEQIQISGLVSSSPVFRRTIIHDPSGCSPSCLSSSANSDGSDSGTPNSALVEILVTCNLFEEINPDPGDLIIDTILISVKRGITVG